MATWQINITKKGLQRASLNKLIKTCEDIKDASVTVTDASPPSTRQERFEQAIGLLNDARAEFESLRDELQEWQEGIPENMQNGEKYDALGEAISELDDIINEVESAEGHDVTFPSMMG